MLCVMVISPGGVNKKGSPELLACLHGARGHCSCQTLQASFEILIVPDLFHWAFVRDHGWNAKGLCAMKRGPVLFAGPSIPLTAPPVPLTAPRFPLRGPF